MSGARIESGADYIESLRGRGLRVFLFGELVEEPVDHPMIRPSINAVAETYDLALREPEVATVESSIAGRRINRFLHIAESPEDLVAQNMMQRKLGQNTGTCFQRCVGMDAFNALHSVTYEIDEKHGTTYHERLLAFLRSDVPTEARLRVLRLIENMTMGRNAVGYLTESLHGAGSPQAQRIQIGRQMDLETKKTLARRLAGIDPRDDD